MHHWLLAVCQREVNYHFLFFFSYFESKLFYLTYFSVTRALARAIQAWTGQNLILERSGRRFPLRLHPQPIRQRRNTTVVEVARCSTHIRPQLVRQRRKTVAIRNPEPIQNRRESASVAVQVDVAQENPVWCICRGEEYGTMIYCENPLCVIQWFHFGCLGMETARKGDWYCANCQLVNQRNQ